MNITDKTALPTLADVDMPDHLNLETMESLENLLHRAGEESIFGTGGMALFGTAYLQGNRLMFTTAMPLPNLVNIAKIDRSKKTASVEEVMEHSNRPAEPQHGKNLNAYLRTTACLGENWIIPSLTLNFGEGLGDDDLHVRLILIAPKRVEGATSWPGIFLVPPGARFALTDGAHRESQFQALLNDAKLPDEQKDRLKQNAVSVNFVFEKSRIASHQDFADCAKAKAIAKSLVVTYDIRDEKNKLTRDLVKSVPFLGHFVDATAPNVNLSSNSTKIWSMSAMRLFTNHVAEQHPDQTERLAVKMKSAGAFFNALIDCIPAFALLAKQLAPVAGEEVIKTGDLRGKRGGNVALRGIGIGIFARAYLDCVKHDIAFETMAKALAAVDWHLLNIDKPSSEDPSFRDKIQENLSPLFSHMVSASESRMKVSSSAADADIAWAKIVQASPVLRDLVPIGHPMVSVDLFPEGCAA